MSQSPTELRDFNYQSSYADAAAQLNKLVRAGKSYSGHERNRCFLNVQGGRFANASMVSGFDFADDGRAIALCDWDGDGDQDFWVANRTAPQLRLMRNQIGDGKQSLRLRLQGTKSNRDAIGARVFVGIRGAAQELQRTVRAGEGFLACHSKEVHFGIGDQQITSVRVSWPSGDVEEFRDCETAGGTYLLKQGQGTAIRLRTHEPAVRSAPINSSTVTALDESMATHNFLLQPVPMPPLVYRTSEGNLVDASVGNNKPTLVNLWATWCMPCLQEIDSWAKREADLTSQVGLLPLSVDGLSDKNTAAPAQLLNKLGYAGQHGEATAPLLDILQQTHNAIYDHHRPLPLPCSFLLDGDGNLRAIYKGKVNPDRILSDVAALSRREPVSDALPFSGRWLGPLGSHNVQLLVEELFREGYRTEANAYVERLTDDQFIARQIGARLFLAQQLAKEDPQTAIRHARSALDRDAQHAGAHERLALLYAQGGKTAEAKIHFEQAIQYQKTPQARVHFNFGKLLRKSRSTPKAWEQFATAVRIDPQFDSAYEQLGLIRASQRQFADAANFFSKATSLQPTKHSYRVNQAMALTQLKRNSEAWEAIQPVIHEPDLPPMALLLGARALGNLNKYSEAISLLERFLESEPNATDVRKQLEAMRRRMQDSQSP